MHATEVLPNILYHGSRFKQNELQPGYNHSRQLVKWDQTENNTFLYATSVRDTAIELGFASSLEKLFDVTYFKVEGKEILIECASELKLKDLAIVPVYLYKIECKDADGWKKNDNEHNGITTEYKTHNCIRAILLCERVDITQWLKGYRVIVRRGAGEAGAALESLEPVKRFSW
jgi:hypothetical protein